MHRADATSLGHLSSSAERGRIGAAERRLLLSILDVRGAPLGAWTADLDWRAIELVAREAKVLPTLAQRVAADGVLVGDAPVRDRLRIALQETAVYNTRLLAELSRTATLLRSAGIACVALKGAVLMARHYPHPAMRHAVDLDLLIDPARFREGIAILRGAGYADAPHTAAVGFDGAPLAEALRARHFHAHTPLCGASGVNLDLHHRVPTSHFEASGGFHAWLQRSLFTQVGDTTVPTCHPNDLAVHLCEHFAVQHHADPRDAPRLLCDLRALFPSEPDWSNLARGPLPQRAAVAIARRLYEATFAPSRVPAALARALQRVAVADPAVVGPMAALSDALSLAERFTKDLSERPHYALRKLFPSSAYMEQRYQVRRGTPRFYARYAGRLLLDPARNLRRMRGSGV